MSINRKPNSLELGCGKIYCFRFWSILKNFPVQEKSLNKLYPLRWSKRFFGKFFLIYNINGLEALTDNDSEKLKREWLIKMSTLSES